MITYWFSNTCVVSISLTFGNLDNAKDIWDMLAQRYNTTNLAQRFQTVTKLHRMHQEPGQSIIEFYSQMTHLWNQLALYEPKWRNKDDASNYITFRDILHLDEFLTATRNEFKNTRASLLHHTPLLSLESALCELISEETQFSTMKLQTSKVVMATASCNMGAPNSIHVGFSSSNQNIQCHYCQKFGHRYSECKKRLSCGNHRAPSHMAATVTHTDTLDMSYTGIAHAPQPSTLSPAEIEALIHQVLFKSTLNTTMSTTPSNSSWYIDSACCNHMTPNSSIFSTKSALPRPTTIYTTNGSHLDVSHIGSVSTHQLSVFDTYLVPNLL
jgi:hypothetical protein